MRPGDPTADGTARCLLCVHPSLGTVRPTAHDEGWVPMTAWPDWMDLPNGLSAPEYEALPEDICRRLANVLETDALIQHIFI